MLPPTRSQYVEVRNNGYYVAGTRIGLDVLVHEYKRGRSAEDIFAAYPSIGTLAKVFGAIAFLLEHPAEVEAYLADQNLILEQIKAHYPMSQDLIDRLETAGKAAPQPA